VTRVSIANAAPVNPGGAYVVYWMIAARRTTHSVALDHAPAFGDELALRCIFWTLGRFDRAWPERAIYGQVRYMTSGSTLKKLRMKKYLARWSAQPSLL